LSVFSETLISTLMHPDVNVKIVGAWCLRCMAVAIPSMMSSLLDCCTHRISGIKNSNDVILGYGYACASLLGGLQLCPLGVPQIKIKILFNIAEELLNTTSQNIKLSLNKISIGWLLLGTFMTVGANVVKKYLPRFVLLWKNSISSALRSFDNDQTNGSDYLQITLEHRTGALASISSFLSNCNEIIDLSILKRIVLIIKSAFVFLKQLSGSLKSHYLIQECKLKISNFRLKLFDVLTNVPAHLYEGIHLFKYILVCVFILF
jgi:hypothetical protein